MTNGLDYKLKVGGDYSELEKSQKEAVKKLAKVQETLIKLNKAELTLLKRGTAERQHQLSIMQRQLGLQQRISALQGRATPTPRASNSSRRPPRDPDANISYQARTSLQEGIGAAHRARYDVQDSGLQERIARARGELQRLHREVGSTRSQRSLIRMRLEYASIRREIASAVRDQQSLNRALRRGNAAANRFSSSVKSVALGFASAYAVIGAGREIFRIGKDFDAMQAGLLAASDGAEAAKENFSFLMDTAKRLGTDVESGVRGFNRLAVSMKGAKFEADEIKHVFSAAQEATATFQLSADKSNLVMLAMSQMASKGKISSEELVRQLSENLPIAMQAAEEATGKTAKELYKMMQNGELLAKDFLVPFSTAMRRIVRENSALQKATEKLTSQQNRMNTAFKELINDVFQGGVSKSLGDVFKSLAHFITKNKKELGEIISIIAELTVVIIKLGVVVADTLIGVVNLIGKIVSFGRAGNGIEFITALFYGFLSVIYRTIAGLEVMKDALTGNFKDVKRYFAESKAVALRAERTAFQRNSANILQQTQALSDKAAPRIEKIEYNSYNSDPKQSMVEFDKYLQETMPSLLAYD